eukprot:4065164-Amphidinium_carterae.1
MSAPPAFFVWSSSINYYGNVSLESQDSLAITVDLSQTRRLGNLASEAKGYFAHTHTQYKKFWRKDSKFKRCRSLWD